MDHLPNENRQQHLQAQVFVPVEQLRESEVSRKAAEVYDVCPVSEGSTREQCAKLEQTVSATEQQAMGLHFTSVTSANVQCVVSFWQAFVGANQTSRCTDIY